MPSRFKEVGFDEICFGEGRFREFQWVGGFEQENGAIEGKVSPINNCECH